MKKYSKDKSFFITIFRAEHVSLNLTLLFLDHCLTVKIKTVLLLLNFIFLIQI